MSWTTITRIIRSLIASTRRKPVTVSYEAEISWENFSSAKPQRRNESLKKQYVEFYQQLFHDWESPLLTIVARAEGRVDYQAVVFVPAKAPHDLYYHAADVGLRLYAEGVLVIEKCADLLLRYLRFVKGIVDSSELPLNISPDAATGAGSQSDSQVANQKNSQPSYRFPSFTHYAKPSADPPSSPVWPESSRLTKRLRLAGTQSP